MDLNADKSGKFGGDVCLSSIRRSGEYKEERQDNNLNVNELRFSIEKILVESRCLSRDRCRMTERRGFHPSFKTFHSEFLFTRLIELSKQRIAYTHTLRPGKGQNRDNSRDLNWN
jgi:hypothetical protein